MLAVLPSFVSSVSVSESNVAASAKSSKTNKKITISPFPRALVGALGPYPRLQFIPGQYGIEVFRYVQQLLLGGLFFFPNTVAAGYVLNAGRFDRELVFDLYIFIVHLFLASKLVDGFGSGVERCFFSRLALDYFNVIFIPWHRFHGWCTY